MMADVKDKQLRMRVGFHFCRYLGCGRVATPGKTASQTGIHERMTEMTSFKVVVKQLPVEAVFHFGRYLGLGRETTPAESARHTVIHSEVERRTV